MIYQDRDRNYWEYICHVPDANATAASVVLKGADGKTKIVPATDVGDDAKPYALVVGKAADPSSDSLKETLAGCRQVSGLRFLALPVFVTASAALAKEYLSNSVLAPDKQMPDWNLIPVVGLTLGVVFICFETVLSFNLISWWRALESRTAQTHWKTVTAHRNRWLLWCARLALFSPYPLAAAYWSQKIPGVPAIGFVPAAATLSFVPIVLWLWASHWRKVA